MTLTAATVLSRSFSLSILLLAAQWLPLFDSSPKLEKDRTWLNSPFFRWDTFHFEGIAKHGYAYEHQWAFTPGTPLLLRLIPNGFIWCIVLILVGCRTADTIRRLTLHHFPRSPSFARLVALLSLLSSSPATLHFAPYAEPFFTLLSYEGMLCAEQGRWVFACLSFALATSFRSNGILLSGYLVWGLVVKPFFEKKELSLRKFCAAFLLSMVSCSPFIYHNYLAFLAFCTGDSAPEWCTRFPPSIYTHVQAKYWNNGFLKYWTVSQIPNFILAIPPLSLMIYFCINYLLVQVKALRSGSPLRPMFPLSILPYILHTIFLCVTLIFFSHTQIVLRLAASLPTIYWGAAWLFVKERKEGVWSHSWVWWSCIWGLLSLGLWTAFLPPA